MSLVSYAPAPLRALAYLFCFTLAAQDTAGLQARQLYYKSKSQLEAEQKPPTEAVKPEAAKVKRKKETSASTRAKSTESRAKSTESQAKTQEAQNPLGLKYAIEQGDASGNYVEVDPDKTFATGDVIRLRMEVNSDAYVYLLSRGSSGEGSFLFPEPGEDNRVRAFHSVQVPSTGDPIKFAEPTGTEILYILVSRTPVADLERFLPGRSTPAETPRAQPRLMAALVPSAEMNALAGRELQSRDLVRGKVKLASSSGSDAAAEHAFYAVNVSAKAGAQVLQKIELKHE